MRNKERLWSHAISDIKINLIWLFSLYLYGNWFWLLISTFDIKMVCPETKRAFVKSESYQLELAVKNMELDTPFSWKINSGNKLKGESKKGPSIYK